MKNRRTHCRSDYGLVGSFPGPVAAQPGPPPGGQPAPSSQFSSNEVLDAGHRFFGSVSRGLAQLVEQA